MMDQRHPMQCLKRLSRFVTALVFAILLGALVSRPALADWKQDCANDIQRAMTNLTVVWKNLNARRQIIHEGPQYVYSLDESERCAPIWKEHIKSFREAGTFVWWSRSAVLICEAGHRMSIEALASAIDIEVIGFWKRRKWRYSQCITAGRRIVLGLDG
ncbi:MAG: hypothetical protein AAGB04_32280 [Pseudomonadota bacterium]